MSRTPWRKLSLWQTPLADLAGDVLFLDLDVVITGSIDAFFDYQPGRFCVAENWTQRGQKVGNTSCYRFHVGNDAYIFDDFNRDPEPILAKFRVEQHYISAEIRDMCFWPDEWCLSFKHSLVPVWPMNFLLAPPLPKTARVIAFTGKPDPDEAVHGIWPVRATWKRLYKHVRPTRWIAEHWRKVRTANTGAAPEFDGFAGVTLRVVLRQSCSVWGPTFRAKLPPRFCSDEALILLRKRSLGLHFSGLCRRCPKHVSSAYASFATKRISLRGRY